MSSDSNKFSRDLVWNIASLAVSGACGIILNYLIGLVYDLSALGIFNQVFAIYIFFSQVAVLGVHHSALQGVAATSDQEERGVIATSAVALTAFLGLVAACAFVLSAPSIAKLLSSADIATGMYWAAPGLVCFALNKVTLATLNGARRMRWYALLQGMRFVLMLVGFGFCLIFGAERAQLPLVLSVAEIVILGLSLWAARDLLALAPLAFLFSRAGDHFRFGIRGVMSGVLGDLHSRVDVLMLGYFASDRLVGIYSFAAILAEGFFQLLVALRVNYAPICAKLLATGAKEELLTIIRRGRNRTYLVALPLAAIVSLLYTYALPYIIPNASIAASAPIFTILLGGMAVSAGYMPFFQILLHARRPGWHTWLMLATVVVNIGANALLIPLAGPEGAAVATAIAFAFSVLFLLLLTRRLLRLRM